jgi:hypothetical protein
MPVLTLETAPETPAAGARKSASSAVSAGPAHATWPSDHLSAPSSVRERPGWMLLLAVVATVLMALPAVAMAQTDIFNLPVVDEIVCGFVSYARGKLAPMLAVGVVILAIIGHWLGVAKMWSQVLYVGIGLGVIMGIATAFARYGTMGSSCIS